MVLRNIISLLVFGFVAQIALGQPKATDFVGNAQRPTLRQIVESDTLGLKPANDQTISMMMKYTPDLIANVDKCRRARRSAHFLTSPSTSLNNQAI